MDYECNANALMSNLTWDLVSPQPNCHIINCKSVYKVK